MAALKCEEQQQEKRKMQSTETLTAVGRQNTKQQFGIFFWSTWIRMNSSFDFFCYGAHALKCIAMESSFLLCSMREYTHSRVSIIHNRLKCFLLGMKMQSSEKKMRRRKNAAERKCPVAENAMKFFHTAVKKCNVFLMQCSMQRNA